MSLKFFSLHNHTGYSLYDGFSSVNDHIEWMLKNAGEDSGGLAVTDHGSMNSVGYIAAAQKKYGDKAKIVFGNEAYYIPSLEKWRELKEKQKEEKEDDDSSLVVEDESESKGKYFDPIKRRNHLVVLAINQTGLTNLFRLTSRSYRQGFYRKPRIDYQMLKDCSEGLMISTACMAGIGGHLSLKNADKSLEEVMKAYDEELLPVLEIFGKDRAFLELQFNKLPEQQTINQHLIEYSKRTGYKLIATADAHFASPDLYRDRELYRLLGYQMLNKEGVDLSVLEKEADELECHLYLKNGDQMFGEYQKTFKNHYDDDALIKEAIERSYDIAHNLIEDVKPDSTIKLPRSVVPKDKSAIEELSEIVKAELKRRGLDKKKEYIERAVYELKIIKEKDSASYFLAMKRILDILRDHMLLGCGRGSGVASLVNYLCGITLVDPIQKGLLFERFISPFRNELPDIDNDLGNREDAVDLLKHHFGDDNVLYISNWNTLKLKSLVKDISRLYSVPFEEVNEVTTKMEEEARPMIMEEIGHDQKLYDFTYDRALKHSETLQDFITRYPKVGERIGNLYKQIKAIGTHAGGILLLDDAEGSLPIIKIRGKDQSPITEGISAQHLGYFGLVKIDLLGLATLKIMQTCIKNILTSLHGKKNCSMADMWDFYNNNLAPGVINEEDEKVFAKVYRDGNFPSVFQFAEQGVQNFVKQAKPKSVDDISAITSIFRPGPLCLSEDTTIYVGYQSTNTKNNRNFGYKRRTIKEVYDLFQNYTPTAPFRIVSVNEDSKEIFRNKILSVHKSGKKKVYKILFHNKKKEWVTNNIKNSVSRVDNIKSSIDHMFLTLSGWKKLGDIEIGEYILVTREQKRHLKDPKKNARKSWSVQGRKSFRDIAFENYKYQCIFCDWKNGSLDVNHISGSRNVNNDVDNLSYMCPNHHREFTEGSITIEKTRTANKENRLPNSDDCRFVKFLGIEEAGEEETYDISVEGPYNNFIAGGFVVHNSGGAHVEYLNRNPNETHREPEHPIIEEVLGHTRGLLIYQEQFMLLAHKLAGFSLGEADKLRKLLVKPSQELGEEMKKERERVGKKFIEGCISKGITRERAEKLWFKEILGFISYGFNAGHAIAYAYTSYQCAWLYTYYEKEWIKACLEEDPKPEEVVAVVASLGYKIASPDVLTSHAKEWVVTDDKRCIPPLTAVKGVGVVAANEMERERRKNNFSCLDDLLYFYDAKGKKKFRWSKFNKKCFESLMRIGAFERLRDDEVFENSKHMYETFHSHFAEIKKGKKPLDRFAYEADKTPWSRYETIEIQKELLGTYDKSLLFTPNVNRVLREYDVLPLSDLCEDVHLHWFIVKGVDKRKTKTGKTYWKLKISDVDDKVHYLNYFKEDAKIQPNSIYLGKLYKNGQWINTEYNGKIARLKED